MKMSHEDARTPADNYDLDLIIAESTGITVDQVDAIPLSIVECMRHHFYTTDMISEQKGGEECEN